MGMANRNKIETAKNMKKYHCLKLVEGVMNDNEQLAVKHLRKLIETRLKNKINHVLESEHLI